MCTRTQSSSLSLLFSSMLLPIMAWALFGFHNCKVEALLTKLCHQFQPQHYKFDTMNEVIPCEGHSRNTKQSPSLGITMATLPVFPMAKQKCPKSWIVPSHKKRGELKIKFFTMINRERQTQVFLLQFCEELLKWQSSIYEECHKRSIS